jgi:S-adenosylmethionine:tRNA ribosyltransferase-isomerase
LWGIFPIRIEDFDYDLPPHLIARSPEPQRDQSRLLVLRRGGEVLAEQHFRDLPQWLARGDLLVLNDTRVLPARLLGRRRRTGGRWEGLFLHEAGGVWEVMAQTRGRPEVGEELLAESPSGELPLVLTGRTPEGRWQLRPSVPGAFLELLSRYGHMPLPPYIRKARRDAGGAEEEAADRDRYQTVFARTPGAIAAPTAGLHFVPELFDALDERGIGRTFVTLHVGAGTFQPVQVEDVAEHRVQPEWGELSTGAAAAIAACRHRGGRVVAVGTTTVRVLETAATVSGPTPRAWAGMTDLTICPPYTFRVVDALITNFHLPRSSLLLLVAAFTGLPSLREAYRIAVAGEYRFYSYGDAMLILTP